MTYPESLVHSSGPFVPANLALPKKKAKKLQHHVPQLSLAKCQEAIAKAYGWSNWFSMAQAIKGGAAPSPPDELCTDETVEARQVAQFTALLDLRIAPWNVEPLVAELALTFSAQTRSELQAEIGPWGSFIEEPVELAPGILYGQCSRFSCYRLSEERQAEMPAPLRLYDTQGWYMEQDYASRVILAFPELFKKSEVENALKEFEVRQPYMFELYTGRPSTALLRFPSIVKRREAAYRNPASLFAIGVFPSWSFIDPTGDKDFKVLVVSAIMGSALANLIDAKGDWPLRSSPSVHWLGMQSGLLIDRVDGFLERADTCLSGLEAGNHLPILETPFVEAPFSEGELDWQYSLSYSTPVKNFKVGPMYLIP